VVSLSSLCPLLDGFFSGNACAFPFDTTSVGGVFLTDHAAVHTAPATVALEVRIGFAGAVVIVVALFCVSFTIDTPAYRHRCFALLYSGEHKAPHCAYGRKDYPAMAGSCAVVSSCPVGTSFLFRRGDLHGCPCSGLPLQRRQFGPTQPYGLSVLKPALLYPIIVSDVKWSGSFTRWRAGNSPPCGGET